ncbi:MAG: DNA repair protein RadC [Hespellia sp.]|nr:DNA repair protein RadC [Hespellia sp.]
MNTTHTGNLKQLKEEERPYEKCEQYGPEHLTDIELLAILLRSGTRGENVLSLAKKILYPIFSQEGILNIHHWTLEQLMQIKGIGKVKAYQILCLSELAKRLAKATAGKGLCFSSPDSIAKYYMEDMRHKKQEYMKLLLFNTRTRLIGETDISKGTVNASLVSPRELFIEALQKNAVSIILLHNHPSGDPSPSREDILITRKVRDAGDLIGIELLDHIIIGDNKYISLGEKGLLS